MSVHAILMILGALTSAVNLAMSVRTGNEQAALGWCTSSLLFVCFAFSG